MADNPSRNSSIRKAQSDPSYDVYDEDPLVELARIVSEDGGYFNISEQRPVTAPPEPAPQPVAGYADEGAEPGIDLESELMEELELSMATPDDEYDDGYDAEDDENYALDHVFAPEDSAALAQMSAAPADLSAEFEENSGDQWSEDAAGFDNGQPAFEEPAYAEPAFVDRTVTREPAPALSADDLSDLEQALSGSDDSQREDDYQQVGEAGMAADFSASSDYPDEWAGEGMDADDDDDGYGVPPVIPMAGEVGRGGHGSQGGSGRKLVAVAAVLSIAILGGGAIAMMSSTSDMPSSGAPPVFKADSGPVKVEPDDVASNDGNQPAFDVVVNSGEPVTEELIDRNEKPVDRIIPLEDAPQTEMLRPVGAGDGKDVARLSASDNPNASAPKFDPIGPRQVRTVKVGADGTIIRPTFDDNIASTSNGDSAIVGGLPNAVANPDASVVPDNEPTPVPVRVVDITSDSSGSQVASRTDDRMSPLTEIVASLPANTSADNAVDFAAAPLPKTRPAETPTVLANTQPSSSQLVAQPARQVPAAAAPDHSATAPVNLLEAARKSAPARTETAPVNTGSTASTGGYLVQLSSQRSQEQAVSAFNGLKRRHPSLLGNLEPNIQKADLGDRGVYYRVRVGPMSGQADAAKFCEQLKTSGGSCFVTR